MPILNNKLSALLLSNLPISWRIIFNPDRIYTSSLILKFECRKNLETTKGSTPLS